MKLGLLSTFFGANLTIFNKQLLEKYSAPVVIFYELGIVLSVMFLGEAIAWPGLTGTALMIAGIVKISRPGKLVG